MFDLISIGAVGIDTNVYLFNNNIDFNVEMNFSENIDYIGQAGGYSARISKTLGLKTGVIDFIGEDYQGNYIRVNFKNWDIPALWFVDPKGTKRSINIMNKAGERKNFYDGKGSMDVRPNVDKCRDFLTNTKVVHFNIVNWSRFLLPIAKELGITISCDIQDAIDANDSYRKDYINFADILFLSGVNIKNIDSFLEQIRNINAKALVIFGLGSRGASMALPGQPCKFYPPPDLNFPIIDTNGAGDSLAIGFLYGFKFLNENPENSLMLGQILARYTCSLKAPKKTFLNQEGLMSLFNNINPIK